MGRIENCGFEEKGHYEEGEEEVGGDLTEIFSPNSRKKDTPESFI